FYTGFDDTVDSVLSGSRSIKTPSSDSVGQRHPQLAQGTAFDLADAFGRHPELVGQVLQGRALAFRQPARFDDPARAVVEHIQRLDQAGTFEIVARAAFQNLGRLGVATIR